MGKRDRKVDIQVSQHCGSLSGRPTQVSPHRDLEGNLWDLSTGGQIVMAKGTKLTENSTWTLADQVPTCILAQLEIPTTGFSHLQGQDSGHICLGNLANSSA